MNIFITVYRKLADDSFMITLDEVMIDIATSGNKNRTIPDSRFNAQAIIDFVHARKNLHALRGQCNGVLPSTFALDDEGKTLYFGNCWVTRSDYDTYKQRVIESGYQALLESSRSVLTAKLGLAVESFGPYDIDCQPSEVTIERFQQLIASN